MATILKTSLQRFYNEERRHADILEAIATGKSELSLRLIEWYVAHDRHTSMAYHAQLKAYTRRLFDPFRRSDRIVFTDYGAHSFETTWGQMNFFKWFIHDGHWDALLRRKAELNDTMMAEMRARRDAPKEAKKAVTEEVVREERRESRRFPTLSFA